MRVVSGTVNAVLMVTLIKPMVRLMVGRWRKRAQESTAAALGIPMQELLEAALIEELASPALQAEAASAGIADIAEGAGGRSTLRLLLLTGVVVAVTTATAYAAAGYIRRRREAQAEERELVAVPIETLSPEEAEGVIQGALAD